MNLHNKTIWLTGASSGIGKALAFELAKHGARLILSSRNTEKLEALKKELPISERHEVVPLDLSEPESLKGKVDSFLMGGREIDVLINNSGITVRGEARNISLAVSREVMEVNYFGTIALTQALLSAVLKQKGMIVNIASVAGKVGGQTMSGYAASKHALIGYMDSLRAEEAKNGLSVLNVCPGFVQTNISVNARTETGEKFGEVSESIANGITAETCAKHIVSAMTKDKREVLIGKGLSRWAPTIKRFFPGLFLTMAAKANIR